jgi:putative ABC transport system substrate-binding protein
MSALILDGLRMSVPVFGLSASQVQMGALAAYHCDYRDIGQQSGELALRILDGERAADIPVAAPRKLLLTINQRSASHLNVELPEELKSKASEIIR